uniref:Uncharacterized protein n=1 Tax=Tetradesmus obliquus TaxID=3088 RepID=A0A383VF51_TETOB|eukprot:jgi/Sobl393_1/15185/SZX63409.1
MEGQQLPWFKTPDVSKRLLNPFVSPGGPPAVSGSAVSNRQSVSEFHEQAAAAMAGLAAAVQQGLAQQQGGHQLSDAQLAAALDASDLHMPYYGGTALQQPLLLTQHPQQLQQQVFAGQSMTATAAATAGPAAAAAAYRQQQQQQQTSGPPASIALLASHREAAAVQQSQGPAAAAPPAVWAGNKPAAAAAAAAAAAGGGGVLQPGQEVLVTLQLFESGLDSRRQVMQELQAVKGTPATVLPAKHAVCASVAWR